MERRERVRRRKERRKSDGCEREEREKIQKRSEGSK